MSRSPVYEAVAADPRTIAFTPHDRHDRCRQRLGQTRTCQRSGNWLIRDDATLLRCTQHALSWILTHPVVPDA